MTPGQIAIRALIVGFSVSMVMVTGFAYTTLLERKLLARLQHRIGPNRAGYIPLPDKNGGERRLIKGFLQPGADAVKLFLKEDQTPAGVDRFVYTLAPMLAVIPAILILAVIPWAGEITIFGAHFAPYFAIAPGLDVAVLYMLSITSIGVYGVVLAGWASNSKYAILGGIRASAQMISYELAMGMSILIPVMLADSLDLGVIVSKQSGYWYALHIPAAAVFLLAVMAELQRLPFDLVEAEQELSSGFNVEYGGMRFGMFFMAEYMKMVIFSAIAATLFFGGYRGPFVDQLPGLGFFYLFLKIVAGLFMLIWIRASFPRLRYDQLMEFGWKRLLPLAVLNFIIVAVVIVLHQEGIIF